MSAHRRSLGFVLLETRVLQDNDPDLAGLLASGFTVVGESWGATLRLRSGSDRERLAGFVEEACAHGLVIRELDHADADAIVALERDTTPDYPYTPATAHRAPQLAEVRAWPEQGRRAFGAIDDGALVGVCVARGGDNDFVSVARSHRGMGIGKAVVAAWVIAGIEQGVTEFTAGGAVQNPGSLGMIRALGFVVDERWLSLQRR